ncbi:MAG: MaoC family dehydratase N-terminal domain-containing protein [Spirochaetes bacterium]|nr:MaoC family dehydratase N-terminal domain-containing protein [Spirochaetota bacterium]MBX3720390.1 MaoC family dehydratase N-terminal domain-containing protein [Turneriella sp.]
MAELSKDIVGRKMDPFTFTVERGKVKEFLQAIGEKNPIYWDIAAAKAAGYSDTPIPLTFQTAFTFWGYGDKFWTDIESFGIDTKRLLHMKEEYTYLEPIYPGTTVTCQVEVIDVKVGKMNMVTFKNTYSDGKGKSFIEAEMAIVIRPEGM